MARELGHPPDWEAVQTALVQAYAEAWECDVEDVRLPAETVSVTVTREGRDGTEVLLLRRRPERGGFWQSVTGRREPQETPAVAAAREVAEETGRALPVRSLHYRHAFALGEASPPLLAQEDAFAATWEGNAEVRLGPEHADFAWLKVPEALQRLPYPGLRRAVERATTSPQSPVWR